MAGHSNAKPHFGREKQILEIRGRRDGESSYRVLTQLLRESIYRERYADDDPLPTDLALAQEHGLSRQTVRRAYQELVAEGLVYRVPGRGTFVTPEKTRYRRTFGTVADLMKLQLDTQFELVLPLTDDVHDAAAAALELPDRHIFAVTFRRLHLGEAFCLTRVFLPPRMARKLADVRELTEPGVRSNVTVIGLLESHGADIAEAQQVITAIGATPSSRQSSAALRVPRSCTSSAPTTTGRASRSSTPSVTSCPTTTPTASGWAATPPERHGVSGVTPIPLPPATDVSTTEGSDMKRTYLKTLAGTAALLLSVAAAGCGARGGGVEAAVTRSTRSGSPTLSRGHAQGQGGQVQEDRRGADRREDRGRDLPQLRAVRRRGRAAGLQSGASRRSPRQARSSPRWPQAPGARPAVPVRATRRHPARRLQGQPGRQRDLRDPKLAGTTSRCSGCGTTASSSSPRTTGSCGPRTCRPELPDPAVRSAAAQFAAWGASPRRWPSPRCTPPCSRGRRRPGEPVLEHRVAEDPHGAAAHHRDRPRLHRLRAGRQQRVPGGLPTTCRQASRTRRMSRPGTTGRGPRINDEAKGRSRIPRAPRRSRTDARGAGGVRRRSSPASGRRRRRDRAGHGRRAAGEARSSNRRRAGRPGRVARPRRRSQSLTVC